MDIEQSLNVSWIDPDESNQPCHLTIVDSTNQQWVTPQESYYIFTAPEGAPPCEVYNFSVTATYVADNVTYAGAGCCVPSPVLSTMLPSLPDLSNLHSFHSFSLEKVTGEIILTVYFQVNDFLLTVS